MSIEHDDWTFAERNSDQYGHFVLLGAKGMTQAYPKVPLENPEQFYSREDALANTMLAASAPAMLRLLKTVTSRLRVLQGDNAGAKRLLEEMESGLQSIEDRSRGLEVKLAMDSPRGSASEAGAHAVQ